MSNQPKHESELFYVAPKEPPSSRRPPRGTVGTIGWLRENLFDGLFNSVVTIITLIVVSFFLYEFFRWSIQSAQWSVVINNLKLLNVGQYPEQEIWRVELVALILVFLSGLGVAVWGSTTRAFMLTIAIVVILMVLIPIAAQRIEPAPVRFLVGDRGNYGPMRFTMDSDETFSISVNAIDQRDEADIEVYSGLIETASGGTNSRITWSEILRAANLDDPERRLDLSAYNQIIKIDLLNRSGLVVASALSTPENRDVTLEYTATQTGWYIVQATIVEEPALYRDLDALQLPRTGVRANEPTGNAWITLHNVPIYNTKPDDVERRTNIYGEIPAVECYTNDPLGCQVAERSLRFEGKRSFWQFTRLQLSPYITDVTVPVLVAIVLFFVAYLLGALGMQSRDASHAKNVTRLTVIGWILLLPVSWVLLSGVSGADKIHPLLQLRQISPEAWQGLLLTLILTFISVVASLPLGVMFALGRRSGLPVIGTFSVLFIELIRGAPLITILFFAKNVVPFFFSAGASQDIGNVMRMLIGLTLFSAAYQAEIVRGGLQIIPQGQTEAAKALGLNTFYTNTFIILPQALRAVIPATMSQFVSLFKDTSLVSIIGLFELLGIVELIVNGQQQYRPFVREAYLYIGIIYFVIAFVMSAVSRRLEETGSGAARQR